MKNTIAFLLHLLLLLPVLLLLEPGHFLTNALDNQCRPTFNTRDYEYTSIITVPETNNSQTTTTRYVHPERNLTVKLEVDEKIAEFLLEEHCFQGDGQWWALFMMVQCGGIHVNHNQEMATYVFQVRTSRCIKQCYETISRRSFGSLNVWAKGASQWRQTAEKEVCGHITQWTKEEYQGPHQSCSDISSTSPSTTIPAWRTTTTDSSKEIKNNSETPYKPSTTTTKPTTTPPTELPTTTNEPKQTTNTTGPTTTSSITDGQLGGVIVGVIAVIVVGAVIVMIVVKKRRSQPPSEEVAMRPQNTESPREGNVNSLYESADRLEPVRDTADRQGPASSLYETAGRQGSVNSLYEPFEKFRAEQ